MHPCAPLVSGCSSARPGGREVGQGRSLTGSRTSTAAEISDCGAFRAPGDQKLLMGTRIGHCHAGMWRASP